MAPRKGRLVAEHERVERITVFAERVGNEAVVGRVPRRREQQAIEPYLAGVVVDLGPMNGVRIDPNKRRARAAAATWWVRQ